MASGATSVSGTLGTRLTEANGGQPVVPGSLVTDGWSAANLLSGPGSLGESGPTIAGIYMHADHATGVAADESTFAPSELAAALPTGSKLVFSMGCHSGIADPAIADTFPAMLNGVGATYLASTGFGYGDDSGVQLHDRLVNYFADQLNGSVTIGEALTRAKQQYFSSQGLYGAYDDKVLETMTLYGLPMFRVGTNPAPPVVPPDVEPDPGAGGVSRASFAFDTTDPGAVDVGMQGALVERTSTDGRWYEVEGSLPLTLPGRPLQPRVDHDVTARAGGELLPAHGALVTGLDEPDLPITGFDAAWSRASLDDAADEPELVAGDVAFPARLATVGTFSDPSGAPLGGDGPPQRQRLVVTPGRFESSGLRDAEGTGTQDLFSRLEGTLLYSASTDFDEPTIRDSSAVVDATANTANFAVEATDDAGIEQVVVLFRDDTGWKRVDLDPVDPTHFELSTPVVSAADTVPYFVQVVDANGNVGVASNKGALFDAGVRPSVSVDSVDLDEPTSGTATATFAVTLSKATSVPVQVDWSTRDGSASSLADYEAGAGTLRFEPGDTSRTVTVTVLADTDDELDEVFSIELSNPTGAAIATGSGTARIIGTATPPPPDTTLSIGDATVVEGAARTRSLRFALSLSEPATEDVSVPYGTRDRDATAGPDYSPRLGHVLIPAGRSSGVVSIPVRGDGVAEPKERFFVELGAPPNVALARRRAVGRIIDDDPSAGMRVAVGDAGIVEGHAGTRTLRFTVSLSATSATPVTVDYTTVAGSASPGADYVTRSGTATIEAGRTSANVNVAVRPDTTVEDVETFLLRLSNPVGAAIGRTNGVGKILDDDS
jgi:hypothetical protein